jgi:hypothetical protein
MEGSAASIGRRETPFRVGDDTVVRGNAETDLR